MGKEVQNSVGSFWNCLLYMNCIILVETRTSIYNAIRSTRFISTRWLIPCAVGTIVSVVTDWYSVLSEPLVSVVNDWHIVLSEPLVSVVTDWYSVLSDPLVSVVTDWYSVLSEPLLSVVIDLYSVLSEPILCVVTDWCSVLSEPIVSVVIDWLIDIMCCRNDLYQWWLIQSCRNYVHKFLRGKPADIQFMFSGSVTEVLRRMTS